MFISKVKKSKAAIRLYTKLNQRGQFKPDSIPIAKFIASGKKAPRVTLVLPHYSKAYSFGGISTALSFANRVVEGVPCEKRIVVASNPRPEDDDLLNVEGWNESVQFLLEDPKIEVGCNEIFIYTSWATAYSMAPVAEQRNITFNRDIKDIYLIQDFEPGFSAWSAEYLMAESTYRTNADQIFAVFNSKELVDYFHMLGYSFGNEFYFDPWFNESLREELAAIMSRGRLKKKRKILIYGRPDTERNAFSLIESGLRIWANQYPEASKWEILSLGQRHDNISLGPKSSIVSKGKVSLTEYAQHLSESFAGVSLMVSPHPSYPPLEMVAFGVRTITNNYANKDLSIYSNNFVSLSSCTPQNIADQLTSICEQYSRDDVHGRLGICQFADDRHTLISAAQIVKQSICQAFGE